MKHVMLDIETMSRRPNAAIVSIGAVPFYPEGKVAAPVSCFYHTISLESCEDAGLHIGADTVEWWLKQSSEARMTLLLSRQPLSLVLDRFTLFLQEVKEKAGQDPFIWGRGPGFDNVILREAYRITGKPCPWNFRKDRCMRTLEMVYKGQGRSVELIEREDLKNMKNRTEHNALSDALFQAGVASIIMQTMGLKL